MKKLIALLLALVMVIAMVACGNANAPEETKAPAKETEAPAKETEAPAADETEAPAEEEPVKITIGMKKKDTVEDYDTNTMTQIVEERLNVDIEWVYFSSDNAEYATQFGLMTTNGEELPDIVVAMSSISLYNEYGQQGYFIDLKPYMTDPEKTPTFDMQMTTCGDAEREFLLGQITCPADGAIYNWPTFMVANVNKTQHHQYINQAWLDELGMEVPTTPDEMYEFLKAVKEAHPEGVGVIGALGYRANVIEWLINAYIYCYDQYFWNVENGQLYAPYNTDEYRQGLIYCNKLYAEGLIDPVTLTTSKDSDCIPYSTPSGSEHAGAALCAGHPQLSMENGHPGVLEYAPAVVLNAGTGKGGFQGWRTNTIEVGCGITTDCENVDKAIELLDFMCSPEMTITSQSGIEGIHWNWVEKDSGKTSYVGIPSTYEKDESIPSIWQQQNNYIWNQDLCSVWNDNAISVWNDDGSFNANRSKLTADHYWSNMSVAEPAEVCRELVYLPDEQEVVDEVKNVLIDYVRSQTHLFVSGDLDPNNDADWEAFCQGLVDQGMEDWQAVAQAAYTRMNG